MNLDNSNELPKYRGLSWLLLGLWVVNVSFFLYYVVSFTIPRLLAGTAL